MGLTPGSTKSNKKAVENYSRRHPFRRRAAGGNPFTTSERRAFERDVYDYARGSGFNTVDAREQVKKARFICATEKGDEDDSALENEMDDSQAILVSVTEKIMKSATVGPDSEMDEVEDDHKHNASTPYFSKFYSHISALTGQNSNPSKRRNTDDQPDAPDPKRQKKQRRKKRTSEAPVQSSDEMPQNNVNEGAKNASKAREEKDNPSETPRETGESRLATPDRPKRKPGRPRKSNTEVEIRVQQNQAKRRQFWNSVFQDKERESSGPAANDDLSESEEEKMQSPVKLEDQNESEDGVELPRSSVNLPLHSKRSEEGIAQKSEEPLSVDGKERKKKKKKDKKRKSLEAAAEGADADLDVASLKKKKKKRRKSSDDQLTSVKKEALQDVPSSPPGEETTSKEKKKKKEKKEKERSEGKNEEKSKDVKKEKKKKERKEKKDGLRKSSSSKAVRDGTGFQSPMIHAE